MKNMWQRNTDSGGDVNRRKILKSAAGAGAGLAALSGVTGSAAAGDKGDCDDFDYSTPHVDTADHFDTTWYGSVYLTDGNSSTNYDIEGSGFPWGADELVVHLHGWKNNYECGIARVEDAQDAYAPLGYSPSVTGLAWDSDYSWGNAKEIAARNGPKLAYFLYVYDYYYPDTTIRLQGHSQGAQVLAETLLQLDEWGLTDVVTSAVFLAGAVVDEEVSMSGKYGPAIERTVDHAENYWDADDTVLNWAFSTYEWSWAIGNNGCNGTAPSNYTDHEVTGHVDGHYSQYWVTPDFIGTWVVPEF